ncbi:MAG: polyhydroxyalkanoate biosynthesis repressor PhaR [Neobacillus sp.]
MSSEKGYEPFEAFKQISDMWEKQLNGMLYMMTDNKEFVRLAKTGLDSHSRYMELLRKNQELMAGLMNIPTKKDVANVAKLSIQAEAKIDILEEQIWNLQDRLGTINKENLELFQEVVNIVKQLRVDFQQTAQEAAEIKKVREELQELRKGLVDIKILQVNLQEVQKDLEEIKAMNNYSETKVIQNDLLEVKTGMGQLTDIKNEITALKGLMNKDVSKGKGKEKEKELVTAK